MKLLLLIILSLAFAVSFSQKQSDMLGTWKLKTWLPASDYNLDNRPHFEVLGEKYKNNDPTSEEEIWIPIKLK